MTGTLYIVATPIGNLEDMTYRAVRILQEADLIAAEDTRHTRKLLNHFGINTPLVSYYREKEVKKSNELVEKLQAGASIALVSDAGTPAVSDPGAVLVREARQAQISIVPVPGACALSAAVSCAGLDPGSFLFLGFPPAKSGQRKKFLHSLAASPFPLVFYESPHRIHKFIEEAVEIFGERTVLWAREITKKFEDIKETSLCDLAASVNSEKIRGELVVIIHPGEPEVMTEQQVTELLKIHRDEGTLSMKDACRKVAEETGYARSQLYQEALIIWGRKNN